MKSITFTAVAIGLGTKTHYQLTVMDASKSAANVFSVA
jgi:hypothetical protein